MQPNQSLDQGREEEKERKRGRGKGEEEKGTSLILTNWASNDCSISVMSPFETLALALFNFFIK